MAGQEGSRQASKTYIYQCLGLLLLCCILTKGMELQEWVLIRTTDGTVIASNYLWGGSTPIALKGDLSKLFGEGDKWHWGMCGLRKTGYYGCPEHKGKNSQCGANQDYYCKRWGCETLAANWSPGGCGGEINTLPWSENKVIGQKRIVIQTRSIQSQC